MWGKVTRNARLGLILGLAMLAAVVDSTLYIVSFLVDGVFACGIGYLCYTIIKE